MKVVLASNILEHAAFPAFVEAARHRYGEVAFLVAGDLLNVFPEPGEDLEGSIFHEIYGGDLIVTEMERLVKGRFADVAESRFLGPLRELFVSSGATYARGKEIASRRYGQLFARLAPALGGSRCYFIPGNMDYPALGFAHVRDTPALHQLDCDVVALGACRVGGVGGVPNTVHPFRGVAEISPYEMTEGEYDRRLRQLWGVDVLVTHVSPEEHPGLDSFLRDSPVRLLICRAPFDFRRQGDFRGQLALGTRAGKHVIKVRPFDYPTNAAFVLDLGGTVDPPAAELFTWTSEAPETR